VSCQVEGDQTRKSTGRWFWFCMKICFPRSECTVKQWPGWLRTERQPLVFGYRPLDYYHLGGPSSSQLWMFQVLGELDKMYRSSKQSVDLLKVQIHSYREQEQAWVQKIKAPIFLFVLLFKAEAGLGWADRRLIGQPSYDWQLWLTERCYKTYCWLHMSLPTIHCYNYTNEMQSTCMKL
jgi:hypothetical protein